ncbi:hypothetical protein HYC85_027439, partial [Camellia sinensis]
YRGIVHFPIGNTLAPFSGVLPDKAHLRCTKGPIANLSCLKTSAPIALIGLTPTRSAYRSPYPLTANRYNYQESRNGRERDALSGHRIQRREISEMRGTGGAVADKRCLQAPVVLPLTKSPRGKRGRTEPQAEGFIKAYVSKERLAPISNFERALQHLEEILCSGVTDKELHSVDSTR